MPITALRKGAKTRVRNIRIEVLMKNAQGPYRTIVTYTDLYRVSNLAGRCSEVAYFAEGLDLAFGDFPLVYTTTEMAHLKILASGNP